MRLERLQVQGFRGLRQLDISFDQKLTVLVGANGAGKTSVLDALSIMLSQYTARLTRSPSSARRLTENDINLQSPRCHIQLLAHDERVGEVQWSLAKLGKREQLLRPGNSELKGLNAFVREIAARQSEGANYLVGETSPIYYDQRRAILDIPKRKRTIPSHLPATAFAEGLKFGGIDFRKLTYWFQERETIELRHQRREPNHVDPQLDAVRRAMTTATGLKNPIYSVEKPRGISVTKGGTHLNFGQLSTGEQVFMALAGDLARRLAILVDPSLDPLKGCAIVMIDELELHLHPRWQRSIVSWLLRTFPNCQFIVSTHSPQVLGEISADNIRVLSWDKGKLSVLIPTATYGRDSNFLLESVLGAEERDPKRAGELERIDLAIAQANYDLAERLIVSLRNSMEGQPPELAVAEARLRRRRAGRT